MAGPKGGIIINFARTSAGGGKRSVPHSQIVSVLTSLTCGRACFARGLESSSEASPTYYLRLGGEVRVVNSLDGIQLIT